MGQAAFGCPSVRNLPDACDWVERQQGELPFPAVSPVADLCFLTNWRPARGGYSFISGSHGAVTLVTAFVSTLYLWWRKHNCQVQDCCSLLQ